MITEIPIAAKLHEDMRSIHSPSVASRDSINSRDTAISAHSLSFNLPDNLLTQPAAANSSQTSR